MEGERAVLRAITDKIVYDMKYLGGQKYEDVYATSRRNQVR